MKKICFLILTVLCGCVLSAAEPVLSFDYTNGPVIKGKYGTPVIVDETQMLDGIPSAIRLDGKKNFMRILGGESFSLEKGGTFYALIRLDEKKDYGMLFFKPQEFLYGYYRGNMYFAFSLKGEKPFSVPFFLGNIPRGKWISVAVTVALRDGAYHVVQYLNGKAQSHKPIAKAYQGHSNPLTIGKGWGGVWFFSGDIALIQAYDVPLSEAEIQALVKKSPFKL